jgi:VWFA-related protein
MRHAVALLLVLCTALPAPAFAQDSRFGAAIEVSIVNVDVIVTDRVGNHVRGLSQSDFEIYEEGKPQPITNFAEYRGEGATRTIVANGAATPDVAPPQKRTMILFVDDIRVFGRPRKQLFDGMKRFVRNNVRPGDTMAIVSWAEGARPKQDFTSDVASLVAALDDLGEERGKAERSKWDAIEFERKQLEYYYAAASAGGGGGSVGTTVSGYEATATVVLDVRQKARTIEAMLQSIGGADGQKILVMLSNRFAPRSGAEYSGVGNQTGVSAESQIRRMLDFAKANGVRVYPVFTRIGDMDLNETASTNAMQVLNNASQHNSLRSMETSSLATIANETGGVVGLGVGDVDRVLAQLSADLSSYYSLAYRATRPVAGAQKRLVVKVKNDAYRVRTRRDVVDRSSEMQMRQRIIASLMQPPKIEGLPIHVFLARARTEKALLHLPLQIKLSMRSLTLLPEGQKRTGGFSVYVAWSGALGTLSEITKRSQPISVPENELAASADKIITYDVEVAATRGVEKLAIAVVDDISQEMGLVRFDLPKPKGR